MYEISRLRKFPRAGVSWGWAEKMIIQNPYFDDARKYEWREALAFFRSELGQGFWETCTPNHPLYKIFDNSSGNVQYIIGLANTLKVLKATSITYDKLLGKILSERKCQNEGRYFVEIARDLLRQGFHFELIPESVSKTPDIQLFHIATGTKLFVEVSHITERDLRNQAYDQFEEVLKAFMDDGIDLPYGCKIKKHMQQEELVAIKQIIAEMRNRVLREKTILFCENVFIKMAVAHPSKAIEFDLWKKENQILGLSGPNLDFDDTKRILFGGKIQNKIKQLPSDAPGILYFPISLMYFLAMRLPESIIGFQDVLKKYPNIIGLTLFSNGGLGMDEKLTCHENIIHTTTRVDGVNRCLLHVPNLGFKLNFSAEAYKALQQSYIS